MDDELSEVTFFSDFPLKLLLWLWLETSDVFESRNAFFEKKFLIMNTLYSHLLIYVFYKKSMELLRKSPSIFFDWQLNFNLYPVWAK